MDLAGGRSYSPLRSLNVLWALRTDQLGAAVDDRVSHDLSRRVFGISDQIPVAQFGVELL